MHFVTWVKSNPDEFATAYEDTLGDLALSLTGSFVGALLVATALWTLGTVAPPEPVS